METLKRRSKSFAKQVLCNRPFVGMTALYIVGKLTSNLLLGAGLATAVRSGIIGLAMYVFAALVIHLLSEDRDSAVRDAADLHPALIVFALVFTVLTWNVLYLIGAVETGVPAWSRTTAAWEAWIRDLAAKHTNLEGTGLIGLPYLLLYVALPALVWAVRRRPLPKMVGLKSLVPALPFVALYAVAFCVIGGISATSLLTLMFVLMWPALGEEFLYRGILQKSLGSAWGNGVTGIVAASFLFALSHIPSYVLAGSGPAVLRWSGLLPVMLTSFFWGYGYHRTGVLWPWVFIHAASNLVRF